MYLKKRVCSNAYRLLFFHFAMRSDRNSAGSDSDHLNQILHIRGLFNVLAEGEDDFQHRSWLQGNSHDPGLS